MSTSRTTATTTSTNLELEVEDRGHLGRNGGRRRERAQGETGSADGVIGLLWLKLS